jgi:hypothetical protein
MRISIVEGGRQIATQIQESLNENSYWILTMFDERDDLEAAREAGFQGTRLDTMLPGKRGLELFGDYVVRAKEPGPAVHSAKFGRRGRTGVALKVLLVSLWVCLRFMATRFVFMHIESR